MRINLFNRYLFSTSSAKRPWTHFKIRRSYNDVHVVWGKMSFMLTKASECEHCGDHTWENAECNECYIARYCECGRRVDYEEWGMEPVKGEYVMCRRCE